MSKKSSKKLKKLQQAEEKELRRIEQEVSLIVARKYPGKKIKIRGNREESIGSLIASVGTRIRKKKKLNLDYAEYLAECDAAAKELRAGPLVGLLLSAGLTSVTSGLVAGGLALAAGLLQWWIQGDPQQEKRAAEDPKVNPTYSGQIGRIARGQVIPAIFCSRKLDPTGGVVTPGLAIYGEIETVNGTQRAKIRQLISYGLLGAIDIDRTKVNDQPIRHYPAATIKVEVLLGGENQLAPLGYDRFCQNLPVIANNEVNGRLLISAVRQTSSFYVDDVSQLSVGNNYSLLANGSYAYAILAIDPVSKLITVLPSAAFPAGDQIITWPSAGASSPILATITAPATPATTNSLAVSANEFEGFGINENYLAEVSGGILFRVTGKRRIVLLSNGSEFFVINVSPALPSAGLFTISGFQRGYFQTTRRVTELHLNLIGRIWARDSIGSLIDFIQIYQLEMRQQNTMNYTPLCLFYIRGKTETPLYRAIQLKDLPLAPYSIRLSPVRVIADQQQLPIYELSDAGNINTYVSVNVSNNSVAIPGIRIQGALTTMTSAQLNALADQSAARTPNNSPQRASTLAIQSVNEIEANGAAIGRAVNLGLPGLATATVEVNFDESISGQVNPLFFVSEGIQTHKLLASGSAIKASATTLNYPPGHGQAMAPGLKLRNTSKRVESEVVAMTPYQIITLDGLNWEQGDIWLLTGTHSTCWLPEIYSWLLRDPKFGISKKVIADYFLDWPTLVENTRWVSGVNQYNQSFAWHGSITSTQNIAAWNNEQSRKVLLQPSQAVRKAYEPHRTPVNMPNPINYNSSNARSFSRQDTIVGLNLVNAFTVTHTVIEPMEDMEYALIVNNHDVKASTWNVARKLDDENASTIQIPECTSEAQAIKTAALLLNIAKWSGRQTLTIDATSIESLSLKLGHALRVQTYSTNYGGEQEGVVVATGANGFRSSQSTYLVRSLSMADNPLGLTDWNADFILAGVSVGDLVVNAETGLSATILAVTQKSLACSPPIAIDTHYEIIDLTPQGLVLAAPDQPPRPFTISRVAGETWIQVAGVTPDVGDPIAIGRINSYERYYQAISIEPTLIKGNKDRKEQIVRIVAANWTPKLFDESEITVSHRKGVKNFPL